MADPKIERGAQALWITYALVSQRDEARAEVARLREEMEDLRYNLALRAYCAPDTDFDTMLSSLDSRISDALHGSVPATPTEPQEQPYACPNLPLCPHPSWVHDIDTPEDPRPICCTDGCDCGQFARGAR